MIHNLVQTILDQEINRQENILVIKGSVPGKPGNLISIQPYTFNTK